MKKTKKIAKFSLNKITVSNLDRIDLDGLRGGTDCPPPTTSVITGDPCYDACEKELGMDNKIETRTCEPGGNN